MTVQFPSAVSPDPALPWHAWPLFIDARSVARRLEQVQARHPGAPNLWQLELGVLRMWHRALFRSDTIGTCIDHPVRSTLRARVLEQRWARFPFLMAERAIAPWDMTGLYSSRERIIRHLLGAHHDRQQCAYDFALLEVHPGALDELRTRLLAVVDGTDPRAVYLRDLCVYERYHEELLTSLDAWLAGEPLFSDSEARDPDVSFAAWLAWCARQPATPDAWWQSVRAGEFRFHEPVEGLPVDAFDVDPRVRELDSLTQSGLKARFEQGRPLARVDLLPGRYRGVSLGLPKVAERLSWKTFVKTILPDGAGGLGGYNVRLEQDWTADDPLCLAPRSMRKQGEEFRFGFYGISETPADKPGGGGVLIDYRLGDNPALDPMSQVVDPLVEVTPGDPTLLISRSYFVVGGRWMPTPTWFVLQHMG